MSGDQGMHHVERRGAPCTCDPLAIHDKKRLFDDERRQRLRQGGRVFPVNGHAVAIHNAGHGQYRRATRNAAEKYSAPRKMPQPLKHPLIAKCDGIPACNDKYKVEIDLFAEVGLRLDDDSAGTGCRGLR